MTYIYMYIHTYIFILNRYFSEKYGRNILEYEGLWGNGDRYSDDNYWNYCYVKSGKGTLSLNCSHILPRPDSISVIAMCVTCGIGTLP